MNTRQGCILVLLFVSTFSMVAPMQVFAQTSKGIELYNAWKFDDAEQAFRDALKSNAKDMEASYYLGLSLLQQEKHSEALEILLKVNAAKPAFPEAFNLQLALARTYLELKQLPEAWKNLEAAAKEHADSADVHACRGFYYMQQENLKQALKECDKAIELDAQNAYAHYYAGHIYLRQGNPAKAVEMFKEFLQLAPLAPEAAKAKALVDALC